MAVLANLRKWRNGEIFNARDYVYERDLIIAQVNRLSTIVGDTQLASGNVNLAVNDLSANSLTLNGETITNFQEAGTKIYYETLPQTPTVDSLFIDYD